MCNNVMALSLDNSTAIDYNSTCSNVSDLMNNLTIDRENGLSQLFPGDLTSLTTSGRIATNLFEKMEKQMEKLWKIYFKKTRCVSSLLETYLPSIEPLIDHICFMNNETVQDIPAAFDNAAKLSSLILEGLTKFIEEIERCLLRECQEDCILTAVSLFKYLSYELNLSCNFSS